MTSTFETQWHPTKNNIRSLKEVSNKNHKFWWVCDKGHEWETSVISRIKGTNCPYCANKKVLKGFNDLATKNPELAKEWNLDKNGFDISTILFSSGKNVWWVCSEGHEWKATVYVRTQRQTGKCPYCNGTKVDPKINSLTKLYPFVASLWHPTKNGDLTPENVIPNSNRKVWWLGDCGHEWERKITAQVSSKEKCSICTQRIVLPGVNDLNTTNPEIIDKWNFSRNLLPLTAVSNTSNHKVWWQCEEGHEWEAKPSVQIKNTICPACSDRKAVPTKNLTTTHPNLAAQWHPDRNTFLPTNVTFTSSLKVWWVCDKGHEWEMPIYRRAKGASCHYCSGYRVLKNFNDLDTVYPDVSSQWHSKKNGELLASDFTSGSNRKVWWQCEEGHEWEATISDRKRHNCPVCSGNTVVSGVNDLATSNPGLVEQWNWSKNIMFTPYNVSNGSNHKVWWLGDCGHEWEATVKSRVSSGSGCPDCVFKNSSSKGERNMSDFLVEKGFNVLSNDRSVISPYELDIYVPEKKLAVEFNGLYWHSETAGKGKYYHYDKWLACKEKGIQLIQVWEDDWERNPELIKNMLSYKLNVSEGRKVFARNTKVVVIGNKESEVFLTKNHIQGYVQGGIRLGLVDENNILVAVMVLKNEPGSEGATLNLLRYATSCPVVGGFTKLLKYVERNFSAKSVVTFSDNTVSDGGLYKNNGFVDVNRIRPDYMYVFKGKRVHKFNFRLKRFREDPELLFEEGLSERELAQLNNLPRIWDAGKIKWVKTFISL